MGDCALPGCLGCIYEWGTTFLPTTCSTRPVQVPVLACHENPVEKPASCAGYAANCSVNEQRSWPAQPTSPIWPKAILDKRKQTHLLSSCLSYKPKRQPLSMTLRTPTACYENALRAFKWKLLCFGGMFGL